MTDNRHNEWVSALADGESADVQGDVTRLLGSDSARQTWSSVHSVRDACDQRLARSAPMGFADAVMARLEGEPAILAPSAKRAKSTSASRPNAIGGWWRPAVGFAVAASVAAVTVIGFDNLRGQPGSESGTPMLDRVAATGGVGSSAVPLRRAAFDNYPDSGYSEAYRPAATQWRGPLEPEPREQNQLNRYLANHSEYSDISNYQGILPYTRFVGYDSTQ